jgi:hypothetical protein
MSDEEHLRGAEGGAEQEGGSEGYEWEGEPDLTSISEEELRARLKELAEEERTVSYRRQVLQGRIDLIRAELVRRGGVALSPEELARILMGGEDASLGPPGAGGV